MKPQIIKFAKHAALCAGLLSLTACVSSSFQQAAGTLKRDFVEGSYGQVHVRISTPETASAKPPLVLLHPTPYSSQFYLPFIEDMRSDRIVIAMDTPGYGDSARPSQTPSMNDYAVNAVKVLTEMGITDPVDIIGYHTGTLIAAEMSILAPKRVNKMVLAGIPVYPSKRLPELYAKYAKPDSLKKDGTHLTSIWKFSTQTMKAGLSLEGAQDHFSDYMQALPYSTQAYYGVFSYPGYERFPLISNPSLFVSINGSLKQETLDAQKVTPNSTPLYLDHITTGLFDVSSTEMAVITRDFLDKD